VRILAIRGSNLASLAQDFEIDLAGGELGAAGLFAITGPTGAGKSTLLDALCLALFDRTPRLGARSQVLIGRSDDVAMRLGAHDVRSLLRRGAAAGWAEVDFEGEGGRRFRARWSVRRARGKATGKLQDQTITLENLDTGERLGGTRTETLDAIQARLGLSFDQFRRSALLAQGDFAAFLRADTRDRADLLERMTGTEIYGALSLAAHRRCGEVEAGLRARRELAARIAVLGDEAPGPPPRPTPSPTRPRSPGPSAAPSWRPTPSAPRPTSPTSRPPRPPPPASAACSLGPRLPSRCAAPGTSASGPAASRSAPTPPAPTRCPSAPPPRGHSRRSR
jgi:energy-coupling factor transporter ATP-binding protein EcfA2